MSITIGKSGRLSIHQPSKPDASGGHGRTRREKRLTIKSRRTTLTQARPATFIALAEDAAAANLPKFVKDEFGASLEYGSLAYGVPK